MSDDKTEINPWYPEPNTVNHQVIGKLGEEASELSARCSRILIQGLDEIDPDTGRTNREELVREISDVMACIEFAESELDISPNKGRIRDKYNGFGRWLFQITGKR